MPNNSTQVPPAVLFPPARLMLLWLALLTACAAPPHSGRQPLHCADELLICENFERDNSLYAWQQSNHSRVNTTSQPAFSGERALKLDATGHGYNASFIGKSLEHYPQLQQNMFGRAWLYLDGENKQMGDFTFIQAQGPAKPLSGAPQNTRVLYRARLDGRHDHFMANYETQADASSDKTWQTDCWKHPQGDGAAEPPAHYKFPHNRWSCVQWHYNAAKNEMRFWLNGKALPDLHVKGEGDGCIADSQQGAWYAPARFTHIQLGIEQYHTWAKPRTLYIDDIAIDDAPIACDGLLD